MNKDTVAVWLFYIGFVLTLAALRWALGTMPSGMPL